MMADCPLLTGGYGAEDHVHECAEVWCAWWDAGRACCSIKTILSVLEECKALLVEISSRESE